jgi:spore coat polysaccharide biosynthesis protein SpsF (cytidylyltransferase family)/RimJ/RimL family protein N-acetyltransferase
VQLRGAQRDDATAIWQIRNAPDVRASSRRQHELAQVEFEREIVEAIERARAEVFLVEVEGEPIGYVRIDPVGSDDEFEIGVAFASRWRGRGMGRAAIADATQRFLASHPGAAIKASIRPGNAASERAFESAGYRPVSDSGEFRVFRAGKSRIPVVVQARTSSVRFPRKVLADLEGRPVLARVLERVRRCSECASVAVATSIRPDDDAVARAAADEGVRVVRGPLDDVLERYRLAAEALAADAVVRITADCPLADPKVVDEVVRTFRASGADYVSNVRPPTFPDGLDVEVISRPALERAAREADSVADREHVTAYIAAHPEMFPSKNVTHEPDLSAMRWTVDYPEDLEFIRAVFRTFRGRESRFETEDVLNAVARDPHLAALMPTGAPAISRSVPSEARISRHGWS